ncbi:cupin domain-containing protein [Brevibacterium sp. ZH18]|uniref:cupin domain-containing protein n=1 Tax=Brevibacterium sp. ZH18 TaxID=2927784 RepID=UPI001F604DB3|nr:cupin domain-containing protein [Brevibacterium sp. ZH18]MCI4012128.1 cupin domain-containing protein [Brevibacterium sp. ZH18]
MSAMEPIRTHDFPLDHEPIEDWQRVGATASATDGAAAEPGSGASPADATTAFADATTAFTELGSIAGADYGLWEMSAGAMRDVEGDEVFLVISGTGRIEFDEPDLPPIELSPGALVRLEDGMKTRWYVDEGPLRKLFIAPGEE